MRLSSLFVLEELETNKRGPSKSHAVKQWCLGLESQSNLTTNRAPVGYAKQRKPKPFGGSCFDVLSRSVGSLCSSVFCTAVVVLWLALHQDRFPLLANTLEEAAGSAGTQKWALILPSSAEYRLLLFTTVIAVRRYPELDSVQDGMAVFGNYLVGTVELYR